MPSPWSGNDIDNTSSQFPFLPIALKTGIIPADFSQVTPPSATNNYSGSMAVVIDWDQSTLINLPAYFIRSCSPSLLPELSVLS